MLDIEDAYEIVGQCGRYQLLLVFFLCFQNFLIPTQMVLMVIVGATPNTDQKNEQNLTTIVTEFHLENSQWKVDLIQSMFMVGYMIGCTFCGQLSDIYGRKKVLLPSVAICGLMNIVGGFTNNWASFMTTRIIAGAATGGCAVCCSLTGELIGAKAWNSIGLIYHVAFSVGIPVLAGLSLWLQDWRMICYVTGAVMSCLSIALCFVMIDSPRWLHSCGRSKEASKLLKMMANRNGRNVPEDFDWTLSPSEKTESSSLLELFRYRRLTVWLLFNAFVWSSAALIYYGLTLSVSDLTPDLYLGITLTGVVEIPAVLLCILLLYSPRVGKKRTVIVTQVFCLIGLAGMCAKPDGEIGWRLSFGLIAKLAVAAGFDVLFLYCIDIFPTSMRTVTVGFSSTIGRLGAIASSFVNLLSTTNQRLPYLVYAVVCAISIVTTLFLPHTDGHPLPQSIEEALDRKRFQKADGEQANLINRESDDMGSRLETNS